MTSRRKQLLEALGTAVTTRPLDRDGLAKVAHEIETELGREVLVEMAGAAGIYECVTKFVDATGKEPIPTSMLTVIALILGPINWVYSQFR